MERYNKRLSLLFLAFMFVICSVNCNAAEEANENVPLSLEWGFWEKIVIVSITATKTNISDLNSLKVPISWIPSLSQPRSVKQMLKNYRILI
jgi:hypothetical protein